jgi:carbamoyl-phosphate synthase small subunit
MIEHSTVSETDTAEQAEGKLILQDGTVFEGKSFGALRPAAGEVVFNTGMVGYPESLTDPSYSGQILCFTYPLIGNYGVPGSEEEFGFSKYFESSRIQARGILICDYSFDNSHWNSEKSLGRWLVEEDIPGFYDIDTRALTKKLREQGTMLGKMVLKQDVEFYDPDKDNLVADVSITQPELYGSGKKRILLVDCGCKYNIIRSLLKRGLEVLRVPWNHDFLSEKYDGILISNGPGEPKHCAPLIENTAKALLDDRPIFGICLGNQILALAAGADTYKLKYGHRSQNQPCIVRGEKRCFITSQNHGFAVDAESLPSGWKEWFVNANDGTNEGIVHESGRFYSVQFHPEASPGPVDTAFLFDQFVESL